MRMRSAALMTLVGTLVTLSLASAQPNQQPPKFTLPNQGTELIRGLLHFHKVTPLSFEALPSEDPQDVIVIGPISQTENGQVVLNLSQTAQHNIL